MSQAQKSSTKEPEHCIKCRIMYGHTNFENMCSVCFKENQKEKNKNNNNLTQTQQLEKVEFKEGQRKQDKQQQQHLQNNEQQLKKICQNPQKQPAEEQQKDSNESQAQKNESQIASQQKQNKEFESLAKFILKKNKKSNLLKQLYDQKQAQKQEAQQQFIRPLKRCFSQIYPEVQKIAGRCTYCNKKTNNLGYDCKNCKNHYCTYHRIPQAHLCSADFFGKCKKKKLQQLMKQKLPHKGKIAQI